MQFDRRRIGEQLAGLAQAGIYIGTSSWKYPGWLGQVYDADRYVWQGRFSESRFRRNCLAEYAEVFPTVCVDAAYYTFPTRDHLKSLAAQVPGSFRFSFKVTDVITVKHFPKLSRLGWRAGQPNPDFLSVDLFRESFLEPLSVIQKQVGLVLFEFSRFYARDFARGRDFVEALDVFLSRLPPGWNYGVEIRNRTFLESAYFQTLLRHGVAPVLNSWEAMPPLTDQLARAGGAEQTGPLGIRLLLRPGRRYADAVKAFHPYDRVQDPQPETRAAVANLIRRTLREGRPYPLWVYVNNRFEGNAPGTIAALLAALGTESD
ncbi:MAG: DUF72 domain-containing protein [Verrucomicrobiota bacterium]|nr:DUF72 domain-containing protein [Limisphaera sp.]MDW8381343.1 DUF72 domain-containing protein [Verrucomicrobiota bacterium]